MIGMNAAQNVNYIEKYLKQKLRRIKFPKKNLLDAYLYAPRVELGALKICYFWNNALEWESGFT